MQNLRARITRTHMKFGQGQSARSFLSPFTSRTPGNAERGARRPRTSAGPAQRWPIPSVHANEAPYRAMAPPPAARAVVTHSWGRRATVARLCGARSHSLLSAPGLPLPFTTDPVGDFFFFFSKLERWGGAGRGGGGPGGRGEIRQPSISSCFSQNR